MLNDAMFFETMIAFSKMAERYKLPPSDKLNHDIRAHMASVLHQLTARVVECENRIPMSLVLTVYYLLVLYQAAGDITAYQIHLKGLKHLAAMELVSTASCFGGFITARVRSADVVNNFLMDGEHIPSNMANVNQGGITCWAATTSEAEKSIPRAFRKLVSDGKVSPRGIYFLSNTRRYFRRPYGHASNDRNSTLLALRMIESMGPTSFPSHALRTKRPKAPASHSSGYS